MTRIIIDVREPSEFNSGNVEGSINMPPSELMAGAHQLSNTPKDTQIILYCRSGARSMASMQILKRMGFTNLVNGVSQAHVTAKYL